MSPGNDDDLLTQVREAARDPYQRERLRQELDNAGLKGSVGTLPTMGSTLSSIGKVMNQQKTSGGSLGAGLGAAAGAGLALLLRRKKPPGAPRSSANPTEAAPEPMSEANLDRPAGTQAQAPAPPPPMPTITPGDLATGAHQLSMGLDAHGNTIHSTDGGQTWLDTSGQPVSGRVYSQTDIGGGDGEGMRKGGRTRGFGKGGATMVLPEPEPEPKRAVLTRRPVPVISTTIVISKKKPEKKTKKVEKKKAGGRIHPKKPEALPPLHGPGNGDEPPAPFKKGGRVQTPRGSGAAIRGKRFSGIY
jgi:hypothetical protein